MKYLKISNKGRLNRKYIEIIGLSTKRDAGPEIIGHKGSGTKLSAVAALRLGLDVSIASTDFMGQYLLSFEQKAVDIDGTVIQQIFFHYKPTKTFKEHAIFPSSMTIDAFRDWDKKIGDDDKESFKVLREFMCNALDADPSFKLSLVNTPEPVPDGETAVYLRFTKEIAQIFKQTERYFKFMNGVPDPIFSASAVGAIYPKSEPDKTRLFVQGVLVDCIKWWRTSVFDYSMVEKTLVSEERIIKNVGEYLRQVSLLFGQLTHAHIAKIILDAVVSGIATFEEESLGHIDGITPVSVKAWLVAVHDLYGPTVAISSGIGDIDRDCNQIYGYTVIAKSSSGLQHFYEKLGIPKASDIVPNSNTLKYELVNYTDLDQESRLRFQYAFDRLVKLYPERAVLPVVFYYPLDEKLRSLAGFSGMGDGKFKEMWVATKTRTSLNESEQSIFRTLLHEGRHCETRAGDYERAFVRKADEDVIRVVYGQLTYAADGILPTFIDPSSRKGK